MCLRSPCLEASCIYLLLVADHIENTAPSIVGDFISDVAQRWRPSNVSCWNMFTGLWPCNVYSRYNIFGFQCVWGEECYMGHDIWVSNRVWGSRFPKRLRFGDCVT
jgi:hypothetical protein